MIKPPIEDLLEKMLLHLVKQIENQNHVASFFSEF